MCLRCHALTLLLRLSGCLWERFQKFGNKEDLDWTIAVERLQLDFAPPNSSYRWSLQDSLSKSRIKRFEKWGCSRDLDRAIILRRDAIQHCPDESKTRLALILGLKDCLSARFRRFSTVEDLDEVIELRRAILKLLPPEHPGRSAEDGNLAVSLAMQFEEKGNEDALNEAISIFQALLALPPENDPNHTVTLSGLAGALKLRSDRRGKVEDLNEATKLFRMVLALRPDGHPGRSGSLENLAMTLQTRFDKMGDASDLDEAIHLWRIALALRLRGKLDQPPPVVNYADYSLAHIGIISDSSEPAGSDRGAPLVRSGRLPDVFKSLDGLARCLQIRFSHKGDLDNLDESIQLSRNALTLLPDNHPKHSSFRNNIGHALRMRFDRSGNPEDLNESIRLHRQALSIHRREHSNPFDLYGNLALALQTRFEQDGDAADLDEAIDFDRIALSLDPEGSPSRYLSLNNLAGALHARFARTNRMNDLHEAVELHRDALALLSEEHSNRSMALSNLGSSLHVLFEKEEDIIVLNESIDLHRAALMLRSEGNPHRFQSLNNVAVVLLRHFEVEGRGDLDESIALFRASLALVPACFPDRSTTVINLANALYTRFKKADRAEDLEESINLLIDAASHEFSGSIARLKVAHRWSTLARTNGHHTTVNAYRTATTLLQRALTFRPSLSAKYDLLSADSGFRTLAVDGAAFAIEKGDLAGAIEVLEQGRGLLWSQMQGLRTPLDRLSEVDSTLSSRLANCCRQLEQLITLPKSGSAKSYQDGDIDGMFTEQLADNALEVVRRLTEEQEAIIEQVRQIPGFEDFLQAAPFTTLQKAASEGPVIMMNFSRFRCDALIVLARDDLPCVCVPLDKDWCQDALHLCKDLLMARYERGVQSTAYDQVLKRTLEVLWDRVVSKVVQKLKQLGISEGSRIWWCPTSHMSWFPFHAAGPHEDAGGRRRYLLDDYISSYTPTLKSLISARAGIRNRKAKLLFVGDTSLPATKKERVAIRKHRRVAKDLLDRNASPDSIMAELRKSEWVHFACHGRLSREPLKSSFALPGGELTLLDIVKANLPNAEFAFLSACHTAEAPLSLAMDEALNLAAAIQFCGFRSVVGTMWQLLDKDGPLLAEAVYMHLRNDAGNGGPGFKGAAAAVRQAALFMRSQKDWTDDGRAVDIATERWVNLVHIGV